MRRSRAAVAALAVVALAVVAWLSAACTAAPHDELAAAVERTLAGSYAYELGVDADAEALRALGPTLSSLVSSVRVAGLRGDDLTELQVSVAGLDVFNLRSLPDGDLYVRLGFSRLAGFSSGVTDPSAEVVARLRARGASEDVVEAVAAAFRGEWLGVDGPVDAAAVDRALRGLGGASARADDPPEGAVRDALCGDVVGFLDCYVDVRATRGDDDRRIHDVGLDLRGLVRALAAVDPTEQVAPLEEELAELPAEVAGTVVVEDGVVTRVTADLAAAFAGAAGTVPGRLELVLAVRDHGAVEPPPAPDVAVTLSSERFVAATEALVAVFEAVGGGAGD